MKKNKILLFIFCFGLISNVLSICTYATNGILKDSETLHSEGIYIITEKDDLNHYIIEADNEKMAEGYYLEKIIIDSTFNEITEKENILDDGYNINERIGEVVNNVQKVATSVYFPDEPLSNDWYDGPTISHKYIFSEEVSPKITAKLGASNNVLEVALGFDITKSVKKNKRSST